MALDNKNITISEVAKLVQPLYKNTYDIGSLCRNAKISPWSKWKPISLNCNTLTDDLLKSANYGIEIFKDYTPQRLYRILSINNFKGFKYKRPTGGESSPYRLGDFRNYEHIALPPITNMYSNNEVISLGGINSDYTVPIESVENFNTEYALKISDLYDFFNDNTGETITTYNRGICFITEDDNYLWSVGNIPYGKWKNSLIGKQVTVIEFLTNLPQNTNYLTHIVNSSDIFAALPFPKYTVTFDNVDVPQTKIAEIYLTSTFSNDLSKINYSLYCDATKDYTTGGILKNVYLYLSKSSEFNSNDLLYVTNFGNIRVPNGEKTEVFTGTYNNKQKDNGEFETNLYLLLFIDGVKVKSQIPLLMTEPFE